jgi:hypothetical protein
MTQKKLTTLVRKRSLDFLQVTFIALVVSILFTKIRVATNKIRKLLLEK